MANKDDAPLTRGEFKTFVKDLVKVLNNTSEHVSRRFDDIEQRLERLESKMDSLTSTVHYIKNDTKVMHPMYELVRADGEDIGRLKIRVDKLENEN